MGDLEKVAVLPEQETTARPIHPRRSTSTSSIVIRNVFVWTLLLACVTFPYRAFSGLWPHQRVWQLTLSGAEKVLAENPLIDGHNDLLILIRAIYGNQIYEKNFTQPFEKGGMIGQVDLPRLDKGGVGGSFWSAFMPCPAEGLDFSDENYAPWRSSNLLICYSRTSAPDTARELMRSHADVIATLEQIDLYNRLSAKYPKYFTLPRNAREASLAFSREHKLISPLAIEGLHQIGNSLATLRLYYELGVRYATLTWNCHNKYADAALVSVNGRTVASKPYWGGVSKAGQELITEMNRMGMLVDLSHVSVDTMRDVLGGSSEKGWNGSIAPPIFSHSSVKAICPHPRNVPDDILQLVKKRNGLVMVNFAPDFISCKASNSSTGLPDFVEETNTLDQVVKHVMYIGELIGYDHVGLGTDYDGIPSTPEGLDDVSKFPDLVNALLKKGVSMRDAGKIVGRNLLRVWKDADEVAARLQKTMLPVEDVLPRRKREQSVEVDGITVWV